MRARQAGLRDQCRGTEAARVLEDTSRRLEAQRLIRLALDPGLAQAFHNGIRRLVLEFELSADEHRFIQIAPAVGETQLIAFADLNVTGIIQHFHGAHRLADFTGPVAGIAA